MTKREQIVHMMAKLLSNGKATNNYNHVNKLARQLRDMEAKGIR